MMNEVTWKLIKIASDHNINVQWSGLLSQFTPPACRLDTRNVLMNLNWHRPEEISFQLAHEISHIINGDPEDEFFYHASFTGHRSVEYKANVGAVKLMVPLYCDETEQEDASSIDFEQRYAVPNFLDDVVRERISNYYH